MKADGFQLPAGVKKALAPAAAALSIAAPAFAEGTGEVRRGLYGPRVMICARQRLEHGAGSHGAKFVSRHCQQQPRGGSAGLPGLGVQLLL
jgi:hypothetical protein